MLPVSLPRALQQLKLTVATAVKAVFKYLRLTLRVKKIPGNLLVAVLDRPTAVDSTLKHPGC